MRHILAISLLILTTNMLFANRYYSTDNGRFLERDPIGYIDSLNPYASRFAINKTDSFGLKGVKPGDRCFVEGLPASVQLTQRPCKRKCVKEPDCCKGPDEIEKDGVQNILITVECTALAADNNGNQRLVYVVYTEFGECEVECPVCYKPKKKTQFEIIDDLIEQDMWREEQGFNPDPEF